MTGIEKTDASRAALAPCLWPGGAVKDYAYTALAHADFKALAERLGDEPQVRLRELPLQGLLILRADTERVPLDEAVKTVLDIELPGRLSSASNADACIRWLSPDEWLLSVSIERACAIETALRSAIEGPLAITDVSGGFTLLELAGEKAREVLQKGSGYDVHPGNFKAGKVVGTTLAKALVTLRCMDSERYELVVRRSFADYVWLWMQRAVAEYRIR